MILAKNLVEKLCLGSNTHHLFPKAPLHVRPRFPSLSDKRLIRGDQNAALWPCLDPHPHALHIYDMAILIGSEVGVDRVGGIQLLVPLPKAGEHLDEARVTSVVMASKQEPWVVCK